MELVLLVCEPESVVVLKVRHLRSVTVRRGFHGLLLGQNVSILRWFSHECEPFLHSPLSFTLQCTQLLGSLLGHKKTLEVFSVLFHVTTTPWRISLPGSRVVTY